jgi:ribosomal protein S18 acetylase RimI-like enzyme
MLVARVESLKDNHLADFVRIYEDSFLPVERTEASKLLFSVSTGQRDCFTATGENALLGFAIVLPLVGAEALFLEYLAVDRLCRRQGVGGALLGYLRERLRQATRSGVVFEVADPDEPQATDRSERLQRIAFYRRQGCSIIEAAPRYRVPRLGDGGVMPYRLMWLPGTCGSSALKGDLLRRTVRAILTESYGLQARDPLVEALVANLATPPEPRTRPHPRPRP